ncbi:hypothetical protein [Neobacillus sp. Marseille-QA0830]
MERAKQVTTVPHADAVVEQNEVVIGDLVEKKLVEEQYFTVYHCKLNGEVTRILDHDFLQVSVIDGAGEISVDGKSFEIHKGTHFILLYGIVTY